MNYKRNYLISGLVGILAIALVLGFVLGRGQDQTESQQTQMESTKGIDFDLFVRVAEILGVEKEQLTDALTQARNEQIDQLVEEGWLGEKQAELMKARTECGFGYFGRLGGPGNPGRRGGW